MAERWRPQRLADLRSFIGNGHGEDHYREFKRQLQPRNQDIARQLAGFAIDGGDIYYGVAERGTGFEIVPLELAGLRRRSSKSRWPAFPRRCSLRGKRSETTLTPPGAYSGLPFRRHTKLRTRSLAPTTSEATSRQGPCLTPPSNG